MLKKTIIAMFVIALAAPAAFAQQDWSGKTYQFYQKYPGYVVTMKGDTVKGFIQHGTRTQMQESVMFWTNPDDKKTKKEYDPKELKAYSVGDKTYHAIPYSGGLMAGPIRFVLLAKGGHISQYVWYSYISTGLIQPPQNNGESTADYDKRITEEKIVWRKGDEKPFEHSKFALGFAKKMSELVSDDKELAQKVADKEKGYGMMQMFDIVDEYNKWYADNHK